MNLTIFILIASAILQLAAVILAIRLIRVSGRFTAWMVLASAFFIQFIRRGYDLYAFLAGDIAHTPDLISETFGLFISLLIVIGISAIAPVIQSLQNISAERERMEKENVFKGMLLDAAADSILVSDLSGRIIFANRAAEQLRGYAGGELIGQDLHKLTTPEYAQLLNGRVAEIQQKGELTYESAHYRHDGTSFPIEVHARLVDVNGAKMVLRTGRDISERKRAEAALRENEEKLRTVVENSPGIISLIDKDGIFLLSAGKGLKAIGLVTNAVTGKSVYDLYKGNPVLDVIKEALTGKYLKEVSTDVNGQIFETTFTPIFNEDGKMSGILNVAENITERKRAQAKELELAKALEIDRLKSLFIASMSHELRTPLNSIIGFTGLLLQGMAGGINDEQHKQLGMVKSSADHLLALINDVIDVTKIEAEKIQLAIEPFDLARLINEIKDSFAVAVGDKGLALKLDQPDKIMIRSDERRVRQIIMNLVSNAVKFTDKGEIGIRVMGNGERVVISVKDTGVGIKNEDMGKLFKQFSRIMVEGQPLQEGTGLGLYLSQKLARVLGGEIRAESEFGKGSEFTLTLPLEYKGA